MPSLTALSLFAVAAVGLLLVPGPAVLYITARSASQGARAGIVSVLGVHTGTVVHIGAAVLGLSAILVTSAAAFTVVKVGGALYLIGLGVSTILGGRAPHRGDRPPPRPLRRIYLDGVVVNVLNPKTALFFLAFLPQFADAGRGPIWSQTLLLGLVFVALGLVTDTAYALAGARIGRWMRNRPAMRPRARVVEGGVLIGLGMVALTVPTQARQSSG